jgi:hypothetical protein
VARREDEPDTYLIEDERRRTCCVTRKGVDDDPMELDARDAEE